MTNMWCSLGFWIWFSKSKVSVNQHPLYPFNKLFSTLLAEKSFSFCYLLLIGMAEKAGDLNWVRHCAKFFTCINSFNILNKLMRMILLLPSFYRWETQGIDCVQICTSSKQQRQNSDPKSMLVVMTLFLLVFILTQYTHFRDEDTGFRDIIWLA